MQQEQEVVVVEREHHHRQPDGHRHPEEAIARPGELEDPEAPRPDGERDRGEQDDRPAPPPIPCGGRARGAAS